MEKALLFTAARLRSSRILLMSFSSLAASSGVTTGCGLRPFLPCDTLVLKCFLKKRRIYTFRAHSL